MKVRIKTPSRLHFGFLDLNGKLGRIYGSLGVAINNPFLLLEIKSAERLSIHGKPLPLLKSLLKKFSQHYQIKPKVKLTLKKTIPQHQGLGSGTQLALALARGLAKIYNIKATTRELAQVMGRGKISGVGVIAFEKGGFIIDGGQRTKNQQEVPPLIFHSSLPSDWNFIVVVPQGQGIFSRKEEQSFKKVIPGKEKIAEKICRVVQMQLLPSLIEKNIEDFGKAITKIDKETGLYFKEVQKGLYKEKITQELVNFMLRAGAKGAGQSSWGPGVYGLVSKKEAGEIEEKVNNFLIEKKIKGVIYKASVDNRGAKVTFL